MQYYERALNLGCDITKQLLTLALIGIACVACLSSNNSGVMSTMIFWAISGNFCLSATAGLLFLMRAVNQQYSEKRCDVYALSLRILSIVQILCVTLGLIILLFQAEKSL